MKDDKPKPPNLDLIQMVQQARMMHDREAVPSRMNAVYWIESKPLMATRVLSPRTGEWRIETTLDKVDDLWAKIRKATEESQLGYKSKVSTSAAKGQSHTSARLIVVRTYDADDSGDVSRVEAALHELGVTSMNYERISES
ncbi:MAG: putative phosphothreonine lyase domain-containing protein [Chloroflexota bacterium]